MLSRKCPVGQEPSALTGGSTCLLQVRSRHHWGHGIVWSWCCQLPAALPRSSSLRFPSICSPVLGRAESCKRPSSQECLEKGKTIVRKTLVFQICFPSNTEQNTTMSKPSAGQNRTTTKKKIKSKNPKQKNKEYQAVAFSLDVVSGNVSFHLWAFQSQDLLL